MRPVTVSLTACIILTCLVAPAFAQKDTPSRRQPPPFSTAMRNHLLKLYDLSNPRIDLDKLFAPGVNKDSIPALTHPRRIKAANAPFPTATGRVAVVVIHQHAVAYPLGILNFHEVANDVVAGVPVAVTYCPLCDSIGVFDRRLPPEDGDADAKPTVLEFGVSGFLLNSNVVMYERHTMGLWSQVFMQAITGPHAGRQLNMLPAQIMPFIRFQREHPDGEVLSTQTGYRRPYSRNPYAGYLKSPQVFRGYNFGYGNDLPPKTLGLGVHAGDIVVFITARRAAKEKVTLETPQGPIVVSANAAGLTVEQAPASAKTIQTFYHSWSAFYPGTRIIDVENAPSAH